MVKITEVIYYGFESELLEAHLAEHRPYVDRMIIAEAACTTTGYPKPLFAKDNWSRYETYDVEHIEIPSSLYKPVIAPPWGTNFRIQDSYKKRYVHPKVCAGADWIFHNDTDEIMANDSWPIIREKLGQNPQWRAAQGYPKLMYGFVNLKAKSRDRHSWRWFRSTQDYDLCYLKGLPRGAIAPTGALGWHFHNCYSTPEDLYWAAWNRLEWWDGPVNVPDMAFWRDIFAKRGQVYKEPNSAVMASIKAFLINDAPEFIQNRLIPIASLPKYIQDNIQLFPVASYSTA